MAYTLRELIDMVQTVPDVRTVLQKLDDKIEWLGGGSSGGVTPIASTDSLPEGSLNLYFTPQRVRNTSLTGLQTTDNSNVNAADTVLSGIGKLQAKSNSYGDVVTYNIGTSGVKVPVLNGVNTWSEKQTFSGGIDGALNGNATSADKVNHALTINGTEYDGSSDTAIDLNATNLYDSTQTLQDINLYGAKSYDMPIGGYPVNGRVILSNGDIVKSTIANNTNDPDSNMTGWVLTNAASQIIDSGGENQQTINNFNSSKITQLLEQAKNTNKLRINISNFGSAGTVTNGSTEAFDSAIAYIKMVCPLVTNSIGQSWFDFSNYELVADDTVFINNPLKVRSTYGLTIKFNTTLADDFVSTSSYAIDSSLAVSGDASLNRRPFHISIYGNINCRYKGNGVYMHDFLHCTIYGNISEYFSRGVATGTSGNELIIMPQATINQWKPTSTVGRAGLPAGITDGTAIDINCGDCVVLGVVAFYHTLGIRVNGRSAYVGAGTHIYGDGAQALLQTSAGGNLQLNGVWFDTSRVQLVAEAQVRACRFYVYATGDSNIGVVINGGVNVSIKGCVFLGSSSGAGVVRDSAAAAERTCIVNDNEYWNGIANNDVRNITPGVIGVTTAGTATVGTATGNYTFDGKWVSINIQIDWNSHTGTGELAITGLPYSPNPSQDVPLNFLLNTSSLNAVTAAYVKSGSGQIRFKSGASSFNVVANGSIVISGRYRAN